MVLFNDVNFKRIYVSNQGGFISLISIMLATFSFWPYLLADYFPVHDTLSQYQFFSVFYSNIYYNNEITEWLPLSSYGLSARSYFIFCIGPMQLLSCYLGKLFAIQDVHILFTMSSILDFSIFLYGVCKFSKTLTNSNVALFFCLMVLSLAVFVDRQYYWNLKIYIALPYCLYATLAFFKDKNLVPLLKGGSLFLFFLMGSIAYASVPIFYFCLIFALAIICFEFSTPKKFSALIKNVVLVNSLNLKSIYLYLVLIVALIAIYFQMFTSLSEELAYFGQGRGKSYGVSLDTFLTYAVIKISLLKAGAAFELVSGYPQSHSHDYMNYAGILILPLAGLGILRQGTGSQHIYALFMSILFVLALVEPNLGLSELIYHLPGFNYVRHIQFFMPLVKIALVFMAGHGLAKILADASIKNLGLLFSLSVAGFWFAFQDERMNENFRDFQYLKATAFVIMCFVLIAMPLIINNIARVLVICIAVFAFGDLVTYRYMIYQMADMHNGNAGDEYKKIRDIKYISERTYPEDTALKKFPIGGNQYSIASSFLGTDTCLHYRQDLVSPVIADLFSQSAVNINHPDPKQRTNIENLDVPKGNLGCGNPKILFLNDESFDMYQQHFSKLDVNEAPGNNNKDAQWKLVNFTNNKLILDVYTPQDTWLIYLDAFSDHWLAKINGQNTVIEPFGKAFKAIKLNSGNTRVEFVHDSSLSRDIIIYSLLLGCFFLLHIHDQKLARRKHV